MRRRFQYLSRHPSKRYKSFVRLQLWGKCPRCECARSLLRHCGVACAQQADAGDARSCNLEGDGASAKECTGVVDAYHARRRATSAGMTNAPHSKVFAARPSAARRMLRNNGNFSDALICSVCIAAPHQPVSTLSRASNHGFRNFKERNPAFHVGAASTWHAKFPQVWFRKRCREDQAAQRAGRGLWRGNCCRPAQSTTGAAGRS